MTLSRDIETLFDHFGGNAQDYQEIGRENEARTARTRWPLLVTLDLTQPSIPVIAQRREGVPAAAGDDAADGPSRRPAAPGQRGKLPLFARAHRRTIPPVENVKLPPAIPAGTLRFSAAPAPVASDVPAGRVAAPGTVAAPATPAGRAAAAPLQGGSAPAAMAHLPRTPSPAFATRPAAPAAPMTQPAPTTSATSPAPSILGKLFKAPEAPKPQQQAPAPEAAPVALTALFERLRGATAQGSVASAAARKVAAPAGNAWLVSGPRRS
ncbi:cellulose biosynthesis protein BcsP [Paraburkholderia sp. BL10I2N1]|uniref:cellulose biosynthesis protein BcsP n=1 Tax=Paraburkholderia sp. BL10I2N1 TaxID=1938796 RepID=UPI00105ED061|nr:cellulose biosynthesis protein BcsP [Paraburkholderia sp. BL10I2N1]TDN63428.1 cellulose biosynthesis protein BcsR [Paraburkholderia sp. BL10I2N1]